MVTDAATPQEHGAVPADESAGSVSRSQLNRFLGGAILGLIGLFVVLRLPVVEAHVLQPWAEFLARLSAASLQWLGQDVSVNGEVLSRSGQSLRVSEECSGIEVIGVYLALTAVYPASWLWRLGGLVWGLVFFQSLNFARILGLFLLDDSSLFDLFHVYLWPLVVVGSGCLSWCLWAAWARTPAARPSAAVSSQIPWLRMLLFVGAVGVLMAFRAAVLNSPPAHGFALGVASGAAQTLSVLGTPTQATGYIVASGNSAISVGAGCAASPTLVITLAALLVLPLSLQMRGISLLLLLPIFYMLNVLRVVGVVAALLYWPDVWRWVEDYFLLSSLMLGIVLGLGWWQTQAMESLKKQRFWLRLGVGLVGGIGVWMLVGGIYGQFLLWTYHQLIAGLGISSADVLPHNPERVLTALPVFQGILFVTFAVGWQWRWPQVLASGVLLFASQLLCWFGVLVLYQGFHIGLHHYFVRGWMLVIPLLLFWIFIRSSQFSRSSRSSRSSTDRLVMVSTEST